MDSRWRIYYADGSTYDGSTTEDAMAAPVWGALVLKAEAQSNAIGYSIRTATFFVWENYEGLTPRWGAKDDLFGLSRYWNRQVGAQKVLVGEEVSDEIYQHARARAVDDGYLRKV